MNLFVVAETTVFFYLKFDSLKHNEIFYLSCFKDTKSFHLIIEKLSYQNYKLDCF